MFGPVRPTQYDLAFSLGGIPVRVVPTFWLAGVLLGFRLLQDPDHGFALLLIWLAVLFVSILVHELGHALVASLFGYPPRIVLYHFGGLAMYEPDHDYTAGKSILISLAGPGAGFLLLGCAFAASLFAAVGGQDGVLLDNALWFAIWINLFWGLVNLLPILPLDGGNVCREVCTSMNRQRGMVWTLWIGVFVGVAVAIGFFLLRLTFTGILFLLIAAQNYMELQQRRY